MWARYVPRLSKQGMSNLTDVILLDSDDDDIVDSVCVGRLMCGDLKKFGLAKAPKKISTGLGSSAPDISLMYLFIKFNPQPERRDALVIIPMSFVAPHVLSQSTIFDLMGAMNEPVPLRCKSPIPNTKF